jgi:hypothetical protein
VCVGNNFSHDVLACYIIKSVLNQSVKGNKAMASATVSKLNPTWPSKSNEGSWRFCAWRSFRTGSEWHAAARSNTQAELYLCAIKTLTWIYNPRFGIINEAK